MNSNEKFSKELCSSTIQKETNTRIYDRNIPSKPLQAYLDVRPVQTKYCVMPIVDPRPELSVKMVQLPTYNTNQVFNPGNTQSPWSGFASQINVESDLRNQFFALQKCSQSVYVPKSNSDLYQYKFIPNSNTVQQHEYLFNKENFSDFDPNPDKKIVGSSLFMNNTRVQIRDIPNKPNCN